MTCASKPAPLLLLVLRRGKRTPFRLRLEGVEARGRRRRAGTGLDEGSRSEGVNVLG